MSETRPAASISFALREPTAVWNQMSPPGSYWYQIGTTSGARCGPAATDNAATCGSARNS